MTNYFVNYQSGLITINTYRLPHAIATDVADILDAIASDSGEVLTASLNDWIAEYSGDLEDDALERLIESDFGLKMFDYPELRDIQRDSTN
jgi:hypothetical protein